LDRKAELSNLGYRLKMKKSYLLLIHQKFLSSDRMIQSFKLTGGKFGSEASLGAPYGALSGNILYSRQVATLPNWVPSEPGRVIKSPNWKAKPSDPKPLVSSSSSIRKTFKKLYEQKDLVRNNKDQYGVICDNI
jgi:hypothetical protein